MITIDEALDRILSAVHPVRAEEVRLLEALGRASAEGIVAQEQVPGFANSAMDGFAVSGAELEAGRREFRVVFDIPAGRYVAEPVGPAEAARIMTGAPLPPGVDTVVQVEHTVVDGDVMTVETAPETGANVRGAGEDVNAGDVIFDTGALLGAAEIGLLAAVGVDRVRVMRRPRVAILATGSELVGAGHPLGPGQIRNSNSYTAYGQTLRAGGDPILLGIARDDLDETRRLLAAALENDVVITSGGVSVGDYDFVKQVQDELGVERRFWGVRTKPGKPLAFGVRGDTLVFGVPGNPVAAMVCFELYIRPALLAMQGRRDIFRPWFYARSAEPVRRSKDRTEVRRCVLSHDPDGTFRFTTTGPQGSGILSSMAGAEALCFVPPEYPGGDAGTQLLVLLLAGGAVERPPFQIAH
ncbi:MAG TPA: gephyrin-like molybdotransferase Glp [Thermoleophilia bacterium]|nr:gephyrin-like molybdotransferase Glp [Thermoleophilia bacterium]